MTIAGWGRVSVQEAFVEGEEFVQQDLPISSCTSHPLLALTNLFFQPRIQEDHLFDLPLHVPTLVRVLRVIGWSGCGHGSKGQEDVSRCLTLCLMFSSSLIDTQRVSVSASRQRE